MDNTGIYHIWSGNCIWSSHRSPGICNAYRDDCNSMQLLDYLHFKWTISFLSLVVCYVQWKGSLRFFRMTKTTVLGALQYSRSPGLSYDGLTHFVISTSKSHNIFDVHARIYLVNLFPLLYTIQVLMLIFKIYSHLYISMKHFYAIFQNVYKNWCIET